MSYKCKIVSVSLKFWLGWLCGIDLPHLMQTHYAILHYFSIE